MTMEATTCFHCGESRELHEHNGMYCADQDETKPGYQFEPCASLGQMTPLQELAILLSPRHLKAVQALQAEIQQLRSMLDAAQTQGLEHSAELLAENERLRAERQELLRLYENERVYWVNKHCMECGQLPHAPICRFAELNDD